MNFWEILGISPTVDIKNIKKAYAIKLKIYHPEDNPEGFMGLRKAYEEALRESKLLAISEDTNTTNNKDNVFTIEEEPTSKFQFDLSKIKENKEQIDLSAVKIAEKFMDNVQEIYRDFFLRIDVSKWEELLSDEIYWRLDVREIIFNKMFEFLLDNYHLPHKIWRLLNEHFLWTNQREHLYKKYYKRNVDYIIYKIEENVIEFNYDFPIEDKVFDYDKFITYREQAFYDLLNNEFECADESIKLAKEIYSDDYDLIRITGLYYYKIEDYERALKEFNHLIDMNSEDIDGYFRRADLYIKFEQYKDALKDYQWLLEKIPEDPNALSGLAKCHRMLGNLLEAKTIYEYIFELYPYDMDAYFQICSINYKLINRYRLELKEKLEDEGLRIEIAQLLYELELYEECFEEIKEMMDSQQSNSSLLFLIGKVLCKLNKYEDGMEWLQKALDLAYANGENGYEILVERGRNHLTNENRDKAIEDFLLAVKINSYDAELLYLLAETFRQKEMYNDSLETINKAIAINPDKWIYRSTRGLLYFYNYNYARARDEHQIVVEGNHQFSEAWFRLGYSYLKLGDYINAERNLTKSIDWDINYNELIWVYLVRAVNYITIGKNDLALKDVLKYKKEKPKDFGGYLMAGYIYCLINNKDKAIIEFCNGSDKIQNSFSLAKAAFCSFYEQNLIEKGIVYLKRMIDIDLEDEWLQIMVAKIFMQLKEEKDAFLLIDYYCDVIKKKKGEACQEIYLFALIAHIKNIENEETVVRNNKLINYLREKQNIFRVKSECNMDTEMPISKERILLSNFLQDNLEYKLEEISLLDVDLNNIIGQLNWINLLIGIGCYKTVLCDLYLIIKNINNNQDNQRIDFLIYRKLTGIILDIVKIITKNQKPRKSFIDKSLVLLDEMVCCLENKKESVFEIYLFRLLRSKNDLLNSIGNIKEWFIHCNELIQRYKSFEDYEVQKYLIIMLYDWSYELETNEKYRDYHTSIKLANELVERYWDSKNYNVLDWVFHSLIGIESIEVNQLEVERNRAIEIYTKIIDFYKKHNYCPPSHQGFIGAMFYNKSMALKVLGKISEAIKVVSEGEILCKGFDEPKGLSSYSELLLLQGYFIIIENKQKLISGEQTYFNSKKLELALDCFEKVIRLDNNKDMVFNAKIFRPYVLLLINKKSNDKTVIELIKDIFVEYKEKAYNEIVTDDFFKEINQDYEYIELVEKIWGKIKTVSKK